MRYSMLFLTSFALTGCDFFDGLRDGFADLVRANEGRPLFAYGATRRDDNDVRVARITEDDLALPVDTFTLPESSTDLTDLVFNNSQSLLAISYIEYVGQREFDPWVRVVDATTGDLDFSVSDNTIGTRLERECNSVLQDAAQEYLEESWLKTSQELPVPQAVFSVFDSSNSESLGAGWVDNRTISVSYSLLINVRYNTSDGFEDYGIFQTDGTTSLRRNGRLDWVIKDCIAAPSPRPVETRELRAGDPTGITLDGEPLLSVFGQVPLESVPISLISRWTD